MIKFAIRSIIKTKVLSIIHVSGLAIAIAAATILFLTAMFELSFDNFHKDADRIALLYNSSEPETGLKNSSSMPVPLASALKTSIPSIELITRVMSGDIILKNGDKEFSSSNRFVDREFLSIFDFPFFSGNINSLDELNDIMITEAMAKNLFGHTEVLGKPIQINNNGEWQAKTISGVLQDIPANSSLQFQTLTRFETIYGYQRLLKLWDHQNHEVFVKLNGFINDKTFVNEVRSFTEQNFKTNIARLKRDGGKKDANGNYYSFHLLPLSKLHTNEFSFGDGISATFPWIMLLISGLIIFIASANFVNLSLASSSSRYKEIGTRKALGGTTWNIIIQLWMESLIICSVALFIGLGLACLILPEYNANMNYQLQLKLLFNSNNLIIFLIIFFILTLVAGGFPALKIASTDVIDSLRGSPKITTSILNSSLTVLQFIIAITLIFATIVIRSQLNYLSQKPLGFNKTEVISIPIGKGINQEDALNRMRLALQQHPWVKSVSGSDINIGRGRDGHLQRSQFSFEHNQKEIITNFMRVDYDYLKTLDIKLSKGRDFDRSHRNETNSVIINKQMALQLGGEDQILGKTLPLNEKSLVIGIIDNFNFLDLKSTIEPLTLSINPNIFPVQYIFVRVETTQLGKTLERVENIWKKINPKAHNLASYLDENTQNLYQNEKALSKIIISGTSIAIIISCFGLFALALLTINRRVKEIGIRKVLGSSVSRIILLLSKEFIRLVLFAFVISAPLAWWIMNTWLQTYAYRIQIQWWMFLLAAVVSIGIAGTTVAWQSFRAARANPLHSLRDD